MFTLLFIVILATSQGPVDISWTIPHLSDAVCMGMAQDSRVGGTMPKESILKADAMCIPEYQSTPQTDPEPVKPKQPKAERFL